MADAAPAEQPQACATRPALPTQPGLKAAAALSYDQPPCSSRGPLPSPPTTPPPLNPSRPPPPPPPPPTHPASCAPALLVQPRTEVEGVVREEPLVVEGVAQQLRDRGAGHGLAVVELVGHVPRVEHLVQRLHVGLHPRRRHHALGVPATAAAVAVVGGGDLLLPWLGTQLHRPRHPQSCVAPPHSRHRGLSSPWPDAVFSACPQPLSSQSQDFRLVACEDGVACGHPRARGHNAVVVACHCHHRASIVVISAGHMPISRQVAGKDDHVGPALTGSMSRAASSAPPQKAPGPETGPAWPRCVWKAADR